MRIDDHLIRYGTCKRVNVSEDLRVRTLGYEHSVLSFQFIDFKGVTCITFTKEGSQVLSGSNDHTLR